MVTMRSEYQFGALQEKLIDGGYVIDVVRIEYMRTSYCEKLVKAQHFIIKTDDDCRVIANYIAYDALTDDTKNEINAFLKKNRLRLVTSL